MVNHCCSQTKEQLSTISCQHHKLFAKQLCLSHHLIKEVHQNERVFELVASVCSGQPPLGLLLRGGKMSFQLRKAELKKLRIL